MKTLLSRIPLIAVSVAAAAGVTLWASAATAARPDTRSSTRPAMQVMVVPTAEHDNFSTSSPQPGQSLQETFGMMRAGKSVGEGFALLTIDTPAPGTARVYGFENIEARFTNQGRVELQGVSCVSCNGASKFAIVGGTGEFVHARGWATSVPVGNQGRDKVTVTFR